ncbi:MAG: tyrosine-type recombinase/integrase [Solirubrobacteraceae bacterium]
MAGFAVGYESWLAGTGICHRAVQDRIWQFWNLSEWLERQGLSAADLDRRRADAHLAERRAAGLVVRGLPSRLEWPLEYLREIGASPPDTELPAGPVDRVLAAYREYMVLERQLAPTTIEGRERIARVFLEDQERRRGALELAELSAADVTRFLASESRRLNVGGMRGLVSKLRPLMVFLHVTGRSEPLRWAVPRVADTHGRLVPRGIDRVTVAALLESCDRSRRCGRRDYAMLLLLVRLGLRCNEVAGMRLRDIDWRAGELLVHGKGGREDRLPLPVDVGEAVADYLLHRPPVACDVVFLRMSAPVGPLTRQAVALAVVRACERVGVPRIAAHRLRHTIATDMLGAGCSLAEVAEVLRHQNLYTTALYARVDHQALRAVVVPWPGGGAA